jgi:hypothetical protein
MSTQTPTYRGAKRYYDLKDARKCVTCSKPLGDDESGIQCRDHSEKARARTLKAHHHRKDARACVSCGKPLGDDEPGLFCRFHKVRRNKRAVERSHRLKESGQCVVCGKPRGETGTGMYCEYHAVKSRSNSDKQRAQKKAQGFCRTHNRDTLNLPICPVCRYEQTDRTVREINFRGLLPAPVSGDELDRCVRCDSCRRVYHVGSSYSFPNLPWNMKLKDEHIGDDPATEIILRYATGENDHGVLAEFKGCSTPERKCIHRLSKIAARLYLRYHRRGETQKLPRACRSHVKDRDVLEAIIMARLLQENAAAAQPHNGNGQKDHSTTKGKAGRPPKLTDHLVYAAIDRLGSRVSVAALARTLGCSRPAINGWVRGQRHPNLDALLEAHRAALGVQ